MMQIWITKLLHDKKEGEFWITELLQKFEIKCSDNNTVTCIRIIWEKYK